MNSNEPSGFRQSSVVFPNRSQRLDSNQNINIFKTGIQVFLT